MFDCQACGACCRAPVADLGKYDDHLQLPIVNQHCSALAGAIGDEVACTIYEDRPQACRDFESGSMECRLVRLEMGLTT